MGNDRFTNGFIVGGLLGGVGGLTLARAGWIGLAIVGTLVAVLAIVGREFSRIADESRF